MSSHTTYLTPPRRVGGFGADKLARVVRESGEMSSMGTEESGFPPEVIENWNFYDSEIPFECLLARTEPRAVKFSHG